MPISFVRCLKLLLLVLVALTMTSCVSLSKQGEGEPTSEELSARITQLEARAAALEEQPLKIRSEHRSATQALRQAREREGELLARLNELQRRLEHVEQSAYSDSGQSEYDVEVEDLRQALAATQRELAASQQDVAKYAHRMQAAKSTHAQEVLTLETQLAQTRAQLTAANPPAAVVPPQWPSIVDTDPEPLQNVSATRDDAYFVERGSDRVPQPTIVKVFYGTNRAKLTTSPWDYVSPFVLPVTLLLLVFAVPKAVRAIIRTYLHRVTINLSRVGFVLGAIWFGFSATHTATQRWQRAHELPLQYGTERQETQAGELSYSLGQVEVSIPPSHVKGTVERANFVYFEFRSDPSRHFVLSDIQEMDGGSFNALLRKRVELSPDKDLFVFVHGFHNTFEDAAFRTAQIAHDSGFKGAPVFYSWPSQGSVLGYTTDENNVGHAEHLLKKFLEQIKEHSGAERIHVVAHSMGSRALTSAVEAIGQESAGRNSAMPIFDEMVLAAPDLDAAEFKEMVPSILLGAKRLTLYASSKDAALAASRRVHGGQYHRAGESFPVPVTVKDVDTIDVSNITSGHSYIADSGHILDDLNNVLVFGRKLDTSIAIRRCASDSVVECEISDNWYWQLRAP